MLILILSLIVGSMLVYVSRFNFQPVSVNLGFYVLPNIPLFYVIIGSLLVGLVLSYLAYLVNAVSNSFVLRGKDGEIRKNKAEVLELTKRVHQLEIKNEKLGKDSGVEPGDKNAL
ncbi:MAG: LapA family protein [Candidatus Roizmanbacteria bacterium]|nr:LapA family protein [Candidatus Roizmanbacteria bacterium]